MYFGGITPQKPQRYTEDGSFRAEVRSAKSNHLKLDKSICMRCNDTLSAPYDRAWDILYAYLAKNWPSILRRRKIDLRRVFPNLCQQNARHVQLYFVKLFGCVAHAQGLPIDFASLARCILYDAACPEIALAVCNDDQSPVGRKLAHCSPIHAWGFEGSDEVDGTVWMYGLSPVMMKVFYRSYGSTLRPINNVWHPLGSLENVPVNMGL